VANGRKSGNPPSSKVAAPLDIVIFAGARRFIFFVFNKFQGRMGHGPGRGHDRADDSVVVGEEGPAIRGLPSVGQLVLCYFAWRHLHASFEDKFLFIYLFYCGLIRVMNSMACGHYFNNCTPLDFQAY